MLPQGDATSSRFSDTETENVNNYIPRIVICEDDTYANDICTRILKKDKYQIFNVFTADECLDFFDDNSKKVDLLLIDIEMPGLKGHQIVRRLIRSGFTGHVLYTSGHTFEILKSKYNMSRDINLITKPFTSEQLLSKVRNLISGSTESTFREPY